jgi:putative transposase
VGYEPGKKVNRRKIHSLVDTLGLPIRIVVHSAGVQDRDGAALLFDKVKFRFPWLECVFADTGYNAQQTYEVAGANGLRLEVVRPNPHAVDFELLTRRWVVERTFLWLGRNRRLAKDFENLTSTLQAFVTLAAIQFGIRRLARS